MIDESKMATMEGPLSKWTNVVKGWQYRWFVLDENAGLLSYYTVCIVYVMDKYLNVCAFSMACVAAYHFTLAVSGDTVTHTHPTCGYW